MELRSRYVKNKDKLRVFCAQHKNTLLLLVIGILVHFAVSIFVYSKFGEQTLFFENEDAHSYVDLGKSLSEGNGFVREGEVSAYRTPLYPLILSIIYSTKLPFIWAVLIFQNIIASVGGVLLYLIGKKIFSPRTGLIAFCLYTGEPYLLLTSNLATTETVFIFLCILIAYFFVRFIEKNELKDVVITSAICGLATLTRPVAYYLPAIMVIVSLISVGFLKKEWKKMGILCGIVVLVYSAVLSPWLARQYVHFKTMHITNIDAFMLYARVAPIVEMDATGLSYEDAAKSVMKRLEEKPGYTYGAVINRFDYYDFMKEETKRMILSNPAPVIHFYAVSSIPTLFGTGYEYILENVFEVERTVSRVSYTEVMLKEGIAGVRRIFSNLDTFQITLLLSVIVWTAVYISIMMLVASRRMWKPYGVYLMFLILMAGYFTFFTLGPASQVRYRLPSFPFFFLLFAAAIEMVLSKKYKKIK